MLFKIKGRSVCTAGLVERYASIRRTSCLLLAELMIVTSVAVDAVSVAMRQFVGGGVTH